VIGATRFGNAGDDLLAEAIAEKLLTSGQFQQVDLADFTVCRETLRQYDAIYVGGGGLLYASQIGQLDWQNLANYFKFPFWCSTDAIPCHLIGVGHQEPERLLELDGPTRRFLRESLRRFHTLTTRDQETAALIWQVGGVRAIVGADLVFSFPRLELPPKPFGGVLFIGEIFNYPALAAWLQNGEKQLARGRRGFALMSHDDFRHLRRLQEIFGEHLEVHDFRQISPQKIQENLANYNLLVGTRFHGFVMGLLAGVPQIVFDRREGKKHRLIRSVFPELLEQLLFDDATGSEAAALLRKEPGALVNQPAGLEAHLVTTANHFSTPRKKMLDDIGL
jgi:polysaccharide pyruvyl transferase WcaK-like protein